jgi:D-alanyl-D-alanine carboxypeptidase
MAQSDLGMGGGLASAVLTPPNGLQQILTTFGDIQDYIRKDGSLDPRWQSDFLARASLPFSVKLAWDLATSVNEFTCHNRLVEVFGEVFAQIVTRGLESKIQTFGGCFSFRPQRNASKLSTHAWGIAVDLNPGTNAQGSAGDMDAEVITIFQDAGFERGGEWQGTRKDAMHFQFCSGY